jgi:hypothetical protein
MQGGFSEDPTMPSSYFLIGPMTDFTIAVYRNPTENRMRLTCWCEASLHKRKRNEA